MEHAFQSSKWKWYELNLDEESIEGAVPNTDSVYKEWLKNLSKDQTNAIDMDNGAEGKEVLWGSLVYLQSAEKEEEKSVFHFYLTREQLILIFLNWITLMSRR